MKPSAHGRAMPLRPFGLRGTEEICVFSVGRSLERSRRAKADVALKKAEAKCKVARIATILKASEKSLNPKSRNAKWSLRN